MRNIIIFSHNSTDISNGVRTSGVI